MDLKSILGFVIVLTAGMLICWGCSGDDDKITDNGTVITEEDLDTAFKELILKTESMIEILDQGGDIDPAQFNYGGLHNVFTGFLSSHPGHAKASFGAGITSIMVLASDQELYDLIDSIIALGDLGFSKVQVPNPTKLSGPREMLRFPSEITSTGIETNFLAQSYLATIMRAATGPIQFSQIQAYIRAKLLPAVDNSIGYFNNVLNYPDFVFWITPELMGDPSYDSVEIDRADFLVFTAGMKTVKSFLHISVAYDVDMPSYDEFGIEYVFNQSARWMSLLGDGATQMATAKAAFLEAADLAETAVAALEAEPAIDPDQTDDLIPADTNATAYNEIKHVIDSVQAYLTAPQWVHYYDMYNQPDSVRVNAGAIFDNPLDGIFTYLPPYDVECEAVVDTIWYYLSPTDSFISDIYEYYGVYITWDANSYGEWIFPDPSFNGILVDISTTAELLDVIGYPEESWQKVDTLRLDLDL